MAVDLMKFERASRTTAACEGNHSTGSVHSLHVNHEKGFMTNTCPFKGHQSGRKRRISLTNETSYLPGEQQMMVSLQLCAIPSEQSGFE